MEIIQKNSSKERRDILLIKILGKYLSFFGIAPWYDFEKEKLICPKTFKYYSLLCTAAMTILSLGLILMRFLDEVYSRVVSVFVLENIALEIAGLSLFVAVALGSSVWNMSTWEILFIKLKKMETVVLTNRTKRNKFITPGNFLFLFILANAYLVLVFILDYGHYDKSNFTPRYFISTLVFRYIEFIVSFFIFFIVIVTKACYERINWICYDCNNVTHENFFKVMGTVKQTFFEMYQLCQIFNKLFGWPILLICFFSVAQVLDCLSFVRPLKANESAVEHWWQLSVHLLYALQIIVWLAAIVFGCNSVRREAKVLLENCYVLEQDLSLVSRERDELENLKKLIKDRSPTFTAAGFFEIRRSTLLSLLSTLTTYFIVVLQFNSR